MRSIQNNLETFHQSGIRPVAISVDKPDAWREVHRLAGYSFTFLSDPQGEVIRRYDLLHPGQGVGGQDISRPAEFLVDTNGVVRWVNLTENYWVRARPEQIFAAAKVLESP